MDDVSHHCHYPPPCAPYHLLGGKRKASVSTFKGKVYINIREFYEDKLTGEEKPGSKGIALTIEQWKVLLSQAEEINAAVAGRSK
eukprot:scaffold51_cov172-Ochromonas_danica.AAC.13